VTANFLTTEGWSGRRLVTTMAEKDLLPIPRVPMPPGN
jgi:hypothetical protein